MFIAAFLALIGLIAEQQRSQQFAVQTQKEGAALIDMAEVRGQQLQRKPDERFSTYEQRILLENEDVQAEYARLHADKVARLRDGLARRGFKKTELDEFYQRPGSAVAIGELGRALSDMSVELRSQGIIQAWSRRLKVRKVLTD